MPAQSVRTDVENILGAPHISPRITVSGHVYHTETGILETVIEPAHPTGRPGRIAAHT